MSDTNTHVLEKINSIIEPAVVGQGYELVDLEWRRESVGWVLRLFIDKQGGVNVDDCAQVSREIGLLLDVEDIIEQAYTLEVSSPGINRPLKKAKDFQKFIGQKVKIKTTRLIENRKNFKGLLSKFEQDVITVLVDNTEVAIPLQEVEKANLDIL